MFIQDVVKRKKAERERLNNKLQNEIRLPVGDPALDWCNGNFARGKCNLIYGPKASSKSTISLIAAGKEQQRVFAAMIDKGIETEGRGWVIVFDSEYSYPDHTDIDPDTGKLTEEAKKARTRYENAGIDPDKLLIITGNEVSKLFRGIGDLKKQVEEDVFAVSAIIIDSWGGIQSEQTKDKLEGNKADDSGKSFGGNAKTIGGVVQYFLNIAAENGITNFWVQHCIQNMDQYGPKWILIGGQKLQFLVHSVLFVESAASKDGHLLDGDVISKDHTEAIAQVGKKIYAKCEKSRFVTEGRKAEFFINFQDVKFVLPEYSLFNLADKLDIFKKSGAWYSFPKDSDGAQKFQGSKGVMTALKEDKDFFNAVYQECMKNESIDATGGIKIGSDEGIEGRK